MAKGNRGPFFDLAQQGRKSKTGDFLRHVAWIDGRRIQHIIHKHCTKGHSASGQPSVPGLVLFKMLLLQTWYGLSDYRVEDRVNGFLTQHRYPIERSFGGIKRWFMSGVTRYVGLEKKHSQHLMESLAYHSKRSPGIVMSMI